jgi:membrane-bound serine protease (ClpP class)
LADFGRRIVGTLIVAGMAAAAGGAAAGQPPPVVGLQIDPEGTPPPPPVPPALLTEAAGDSAADRSASTGLVHLVVMDDVIGPVSSRFLIDGIESAEAAGAACVILQIDTPGGLDKSMRLVIKAIQTSTVPVVVWVAPSGARAASAGAIIGIAAHVLAMAPGTNIGAAHPVNMGGGQMDETMAAKVTNDAVAYARSLARQRGRSEEWAEQAVRESVSAQADAAVEANVADLLAADVDGLLDALDGREVTVVGGRRALSTRGARVERFEPGARYRLLSAISEPTVAYILLMLGFYGLFFELSNPGSVVPGVVGAICLVLAFFSLQSLPVNYAGLALILIGAGLLLAEVKVTSYGLLGVAGVGSILLGSIMLIDSPAPFLRISRTVIVAVTLMSAAFFFFAVGAAVRVRMRPPTTGIEGLIGMTGVTRSRIEGEGSAFVRGEIWTVTADEVVEPDEKIRVVRMHGLKPHVERVPKG